MSSIERPRTAVASAPSRVPIGPPIRPGTSPGGGFGRSPSFEIPKSPSFKTNSFESVKLHHTLKLENKLTPKTENPLKTEPPKGSQRFAQLGNTREYRINRNVDPLEKTVPKSEIKSMHKVAEAPKIPTARAEVPTAFQQAFAKSSESTLDPSKPKVPDAFYKAFEQSAEHTLNPTKAKVPEQFQNAFTDKPESFLDPFKKDESIKLNQLPKGRARFQKNAELLTKMSEIKKAAPRNETKSEIAALLKDQKVSLNEVFKNQNVEPSKYASLIKDQKLTLIEALKTEVPTQTKREVVTNLLKDNGASLSEVFAKIIPEKELAEIKTQTPNQTRRELVTKLLTDQKVPLAEITKVSEQLAVQKPESPKPEIKNTISLKTLEQNLNIVKQVLSESKQSPELKITPDLITELAKSEKVIDFQHAKELIESKKSEVPEKTATPIVETSIQAVQILEQAKQQAEQTIQINSEKPVLQPQIETTIQILQQPEKINIDPEKRAEAIELLKQVANTQEYAASPDLQQKMKAVVKQEQERVIEEAEMVKTAQYLIEAGAEPEVVTARLQAVTEIKQLPINKEQIAVILQKAENKATQYPRLVAENGQIIEEDDEYQIMLKELQLLLIELDAKKLEKRFEAVFKAFEKSWLEAQQQGREHINGGDIVGNLPSNPEELKSNLPVETDGSLVELVEDIEKIGNFDNLDQARHQLTNILINHLPGKTTNQPTYQRLSDQQVQEIFRGGNYPAQMGNKPNTYFLPQAA